MRSTVRVAQSEGRHQAARLDRLRDRRPSAAGFPACSGSCPPPASDGSSGASGRVHSRPGRCAAHPMTIDARLREERRLCPSSAWPRRRRLASLSFASQRSNSSGGSTTTRNSMLACWVPQYSAHWPTNRPGLVRLEPHRVGAAGNQVGLPRQPRHPEAMADVGRLKSQEDRPWLTRPRSPECAARWPW